MVFLLGIGLCLCAGGVVGALCRARGGLIIGLLLAIGSALFPIAFMLDAYLGAATYRRVGPSDPGDASAYVFLGAVIVAPVLYLLGLTATLIGFLVGSRIGRAEEEDSAPHPLKLN